MSNSTSESPSATRQSAPIPARWDVPDAIRVRLGREAGPQRAMIESDNLLVILHEPPEPDGSERQPAVFWRNPAGEWKVNRQQSRPGGISDLLKSYEDILLKLETAETRATTAQEYHNVLEAVAPVLRATRGVHRALQQAREMVRDDREVINHRDRAAALERTAELILQDAQFGISFIAARQSESQAESARSMAETAHRLNIMAALFLPVTAVASVLSMEVHSGLSDTRENFWLIVGGSFVLGLLVALSVRKRA